MARITILPDILCNQIAAGEVVERPAAVAKELLENSIDAGARRISLSIADGGRKEIRVVDNGSGMHPDDALLALERHATSKIRSVEDLQAIGSLGFRGEALPSIAAVSRFELVTREPDAVAGTLIRVEGGVVREVRETGSPAGTRITVRDLFYNVPARRKFLRAADTETAYISDQFQRLAMAHHAIHFQLINRERTQYDFPGAASPEERAGQVLGAETLKRAIPFCVENASARIRGMVGTPDLQRANSHSLFVFVNGRPVWDRAVNRAILAAFESLIPRGKFPVAVLFLELDPLHVDVNVHPTKREVRFKHPGGVIDTVRGAIRDALRHLRPLHGSAAPAPRPFSETADQRAFRDSLVREGQLSFDRGRPLSRPPGFPSERWRERHRPDAEPPYPLLREPAPTENPRRESGASPAPPADSLFDEGAAPQPGNPDTDFFAEPERAAGGPASTHAPITADTAAFADAFQAFGAATHLHAGDVPALAELPVIGQLANTYILLEAPDGLILIDQHAAHERIIFDALSLPAGGPARQRLIRPAVIDLPPRDAAMLRRWLPLLEEIGVEIESFGGDSFVVHAVPAPLGECPPEGLVRELLASAIEGDDAPRWNVLGRLAKTAACHRAVRAGQRLRPEEIRLLLEGLDRTRFASTCPHGRPVWHKMTLSDVARLFQRT